MPECRITSKTSKVDNAKFAYDSNVDTISFDLTDKVLLLQEENIYCSWIRWNYIRLFRLAIIVFDTGAGANFDTTAFLSLEWWQRIKLVIYICHRSASHDQITVNDSMVLSVPLEISRVSVQFSLVDSFAILVLIGPAYINRSMTVYSTKNKCSSCPFVLSFNLWASAPVLKYIKTIDITENSWQLSDPRAPLFEVSKFVIISDNSKEMVPFNSRRLVYIFSAHPNVLKSFLSLPASGMVDTVPDKSVHVLMWTFLKNRRALFGICLEFRAVGTD